jgi:hypothetical protein
MNSQYGYDMKDIDQLIMPSGRSIKRCKNDAKRLAKQLRTSGQSINYSAVLDIIAKRNGMNMPWNKAVSTLANQHLGSKERLELAPHPTHPDLSNYVDSVLCASNETINWIWTDTANGSFVSGYELTLSKKVQFP